MRVVIKSILITVVLGLFTVTSAQLPPKIMADKHLIHAEQLYAAKDYVEAFNVMKKILVLQKEHNLTLSDEFHFKYAQVALAADSTQIAFESVTRYLSATGDEGQFYKEALALMLKAEGNYVMTAEDFYNEVIKTQGTCGGLPVGSSCWMELTNHPECYVWNDDLQEGATAIWSGKCSGHLPEGEGTLTWYHIHKDENGKQTQRKYWEHTGTFQKGKQQGQWVVRGYEYYSNGNHEWVEEGSYVEGKKHGKWVLITPDGRYESSNPYVNGKKHGYSMSKTKDSDYQDISEKLYLDGEEYDSWGFLMRPGSSVSIEVEGPDENGNGHLTYRNSDGDEWGGSYVNGKRHGHWITRSWSFSAGKDRVFEGSYVEGEEHGKWVFREPDGTIWGGPYVNGKRHGKWVTRNLYPKISDENFDRSGFVGEGSYVEGKEHGKWVFRHPNGDIVKLQYRNGEEQYPKLWYDYDEEKCWSVYDYNKKFYEYDKKKKVKKEICFE